MAAIVPILMLSTMRYRGGDTYSGGYGGGPPPDLKGCLWIVLVVGLLIAGLIALFVCFTIG